MSWSNFEAADGQIISINMDEVVSVINYPNDKADIVMKNGCMHTVTFIGPWEPEEQHPMDEPHPINEVIQDLKLENDRLKRREEIMLHFIRSVACVFSCGECDIKDDQKRCHYLEFSDSISTGSRMKKSATKILNELEDL